MEYIKLFILSMLPIIELRGAIPLGIAMDLNPIYLYLTCVIGSSIIAFPIVLLFRKIIEYLRYRKYFNIIIRWIDKKLEKRAKKLKALSIIGIMIFVGVPLPTTGTWSAAAIASVLKMRLKDVLLGIFIGNAIAGIIIIIVSMHVFEGISIGTIIITILVSIIVGYIMVKKKKTIRKEEVLFNIEK